MLPEETAKHWGTLEDPGSDVPPAHKQGSMVINLVTLVPKLDLAYQGKTLVSASKPVAGLLCHTG